MEKCDYCAHFEKKKDESSFVSNYRSISLVNNFSKVLEFVVNCHMSHYFTSKLNPNQHGFVKMKSTITNLVTYFDFISPFVSFQRQVDSVYFDCSSAFDFVPHSVLFYKLCAYGLSDSHYLTDRYSSVRILGVFFVSFCCFFWCCTRICIGSSSFQYIF
jgi:hypothetical protein